MNGEVLYSKDPNRKIFTKREPNGVYAAISPWNFPMVMPAEHIAPILVAGNTLVMKPASYTPISAVHFAEAIERAGCPKGIFNLVMGPGPTVGEQMVSHPLVDAVAFTGEDETGKRIQQIAGFEKPSAVMGAVLVLKSYAKTLMLLRAAQLLLAGWRMQAQVCCSTQRSSRA
jgi:acyl-CoA reductase-like NAD-dependent aldehyde dehydrogenase